MPVPTGNFQKALLDAINLVGRAVELDPTSAREMIEGEYRPW
jgi:hypothetical protein